MRHKLMKLWAQIGWISRRPGMRIAWTNDPELRRMARAAGSNEPGQK